MPDPFDLAAGWLQEHLLLPLMYQFGWMQWEDLSYGWALFAIYGAVQVMVTYAVCLPLERWRPLEHWPDRKAVDGRHHLHRRLARRRAAAGDLRAVLSGAGLAERHAGRSRHRAADAGAGFPPLLGKPVATFLIYVLILDCADYWRHRLSHRIGWWWALHSLHHAQKQMTFWSDDRNHLLDDLLSALWFGVVALLIGIPPMQFPLLVLVLRFLESLSHANVRLSFGAVGERLLISPRFHRAHHGVLAAGQQSCNYGAILPIWDMLFGTADFSRAPVETGDPGAPEAMVSGGYVAQQWAGIRRMARMIGSRRRPMGAPRSAP